MLHRLQTWKGTANCVQKAIFTRVIILVIKMELITECTMKFF